MLKDDRHRCGLTAATSTVPLRRQGVEDPDEACYAVLEPHGQISVVCRNIDADLVRDIVEQTRGGQLEADDRARSGRRAAGVGDRQR